MEELIKALFQNSPMVGIMVVGLWFVFKRLNKVQGEYIDSQKDTINALVRKSEECERGREQLNQDFRKLQSDVIEKLTNITKP